jgi:hypothetical protein
MLDQREEELKSDRPPPVPPSVIRSAWLGR